MEGDSGENQTTAVAVASPSAAKPAAKNNKHNSNGNGTPATESTSKSGDSPANEKEDTTTNNNNNKSSTNGKTSSSSSAKKKKSNGKTSDNNNNNTSAKKKTPKAASKAKDETDNDEKKDGDDKEDNNNDANKKAPSATRGTSKSYIQLVHEAIVALKDRTGSSQPAIQKYLAATYPNVQSSATPKRFSQHVLQALKTGVKTGRFQKIKASFKINADFKKKQVAAQKRKKAQEVKKRKEKEIQKKKEQEAVKQQQLKEKKDPVQAKIDLLREKDPDSAELKRLLAERKRKEEAEARKKMVAERLKRRRFPMEDTRLHQEDKELGIKPPKDVGPRPILPLFFALTKTDDRRSNQKYAATASRCESLDKDSSRGLVSDLLQVYHFFRGDVHYVGTGEDTADREIVPPFTLKHLIYAVDDILSGTAKRARMVPPLIVHLFVTCLQMLTAPPETGGVIEDDSKERRQLQRDFCTHLNVALSPTSWADVCHMYMDAIDRHYTTEASVGKNVLPGLPIDVNYVLGVTDEEAEMPFTELPAGYTGYLGDPEGTLARAHTKLDRMDPWLLTAEEIMALLRALTDDVLSRKPEICEDISNREEKMYELLKAKRAADAKFRKIRLAFEGPKQKPRKPAATGTGNEEKSGPEANANANQTNDENEDSKRKSLDGGDGETQEKAEEQWKPTVTKKQYESAKKAQQKASDAYEKGVRKLMARTEPIGWDRHHNAVYCFRHDPEVLYVEMVKPSPVPGLNVPEEMQPLKSSWHVIESKSLFDQFAQSLDMRGKRENALYQEMTGEGAQQSLRRFLYDDIKERATAASQLKEKEVLKRRLENAKLKCDEEEGRRSGRLASRAEEELGHIEEEIAQLEHKIKNGAIVKELDYEELTGLELLKKYDAPAKIETRKTREKKATATVNKFESMNCSKLCSTGNLDGSGLMGMLVARMLEVEEACESLAPWERTDVSREKWIADLENLVVAWNIASPVLIGPAEGPSNMTSPRQSDSTSTPTSSFTGSNTKKRLSTGGGGPDSKRLKADSETGPSSFTISQAVAKLRQPLLDLEKRVFEITGLAMAAKDVADADDNMSTSEEDEDAAKESKEKRAWKKIVNKLRDLPSKRHLVIREVVVEAIAAARKAQLKAVVGQLRAALLEFHPNAAGACKIAALKVLDSHGGYDFEADEEDMEEEEPNDDAADADAEPEIPSALCAEAVIVNSSLDGIEDSGHNDWVDAVKSAKTLSRMACLVTAFVKRANGKLNKAHEEREILEKAITVWEKEEERRLRNQSKDDSDNNNKPRKGSSYVVSEVWANVKFTDEIIMTRVEPYPWWPAKKCVARDAGLDSSLKSVHRCLVSFLGESGGIRVVETSCVRPFTGKLVEEEENIDMSDVTKETKTQLDDCMAMARRIIRSHSTKKKGAGRSKGEEKKAAA